MVNVFMTLINRVACRFDLESDISLSSENRMSNTQKTNQIWKSRWLCQLNVCWRWKICRIFLLIKTESCIINGTISLTTAPSTCYYFFSNLSPPTSLTSWVKLNHDKPLQITQTSWFSMVKLYTTTCEHRYRLRFIE